MTPFKLILGILIMSVMKEVEVAKLKAPCPIKTASFRLAHLSKIF